MPMQKQLLKFQIMIFILQEGFKSVSKIKFDTAVQKFRVVKIFKIVLK